MAALGSVAVAAALYTGGAAPGADDSGFGSAGWVYPGAEAVAAVLPQRDGKILVVDEQANLLRLLPDGRRDRSFGKDGKAAGPPVACDRYQRTRVAVQPDGKLVIAQCSMLTRRLTDGSLDRSFGVGGRVVVKSAGVSGLAVAPDGTIVAGLVPFDRPLGLLLARYLPNGRPDTSFGSGGRRAVAPRLYDLRSTFASNALAAGITMFELARIMGTSAKMIEQHYGTLIDTAHNAILSRLEAAGG